MEKALEIFKELVGDRVDSLDGSRYPEKVADIITNALSVEFGEKKAREIAFHLTDWNSDSAFITALLLFPEKFTKEEIEDGIMSFIVHAPYHIARAAELLNCPVDDIYKEDKQ